MSENIGRGDRIRTCDFYLPKVALYQAELHPDPDPLWRGAHSSGDDTGRATDPVC